LKKNVNKNRASEKVAVAGPGRVAQRNRTRRAIVDAAMQLLSDGATPSVSEIAEAAQVSRRTVYMHFPTLEQLLLDATVGALTQNTVEPVLAETTSKDPIARIEQLSRAMNNQSAETLHLGRALIRLTVEADEPPAGGPRRGHRRVQWIERALAPAREKMSSHEFERLVSAMCVLIGWEPLIVLKDVRCLDAKQTDDVLSFAIRAVVEKALQEAKSRKKVSPQNS
jgi:AcrR family transcriptional regulator